MRVNLNELVSTTYIFKIFSMIILTSYTFFKITDNKLPHIKKIIISLIYIIFTSILVTWIKYKFNYLTSIVSLVILLSIIYSIITESNMGYTMLAVIISLSLNYILLFISIISSYVINKIYFIEIDFINLIIMVIIQWGLLCILLRIKKLKYGITFLKKNKQDEYFDIIILNMGMVLLFSFITLVTTNVSTIKSLFVAFIIFAIIMIITIYKSIRLYYKHKLLVKELEATKEELESIKKDNEALEQENLNFSKKSHSIAHKQKALEYKLNQLMMNTEMADEIGIKDRLQNISKEINENTINVELTKTDIPEIDDILNYMKSECEQNNIEFNLQITDNIHYMVNNIIPKDELEILIADHVKDAIIAVKHSNNINKSILVRLGKIDECYSLYIYDSGIEFEEETLANLGKKPCTTHKDEGGTGMGFMNTFDTLRKHNASLIINELGMPSKENYTKVIMIKFDNKNEFKIISYKEDNSKIIK